MKIIRELTLMLIAWFIWFCLYMILSNTSNILTNQKTIDSHITQISKQLECDLDIDCWN